MLSFFLHFHPFISFTLVVFFCVTVAILGIIVIRRLFKEEYLKENHEVAGMIFNAFGLIYAVLVAFVVFTTWNFYDTCKKNVEMEASKLSDLFMNAGGFDDPLKNNIRIALIEYGKTVIEHEWPAMASNGKVPVKSIEAQRNVWAANSNVDVKKIKNPNMYDVSLSQLNGMAEYRRLRWFSSRSSIPRVIWLVLLVGGILSVSYTFFFGTKNIKAQCVMTSAFTVVNFMVLFLIYMLDHPSPARCSILFSMPLFLHVIFVRNPQASRSNADEQTPFTKRKPYMMTFGGT